MTDRYFLLSGLSYVMIMQPILWEKSSYHLTFVLVISTTDFPLHSVVLSLILPLCHFSLLWVVGNKVKRICLFLPYSKTSFTTFCTQAIGYLRLKRLSKREKWACRPTNNGLLWKEKMTAEKENIVDFLLAGLTLQCCLTWGTKGGKLHRPKHWAQESKRVSKTEWKWERGKGKM